MKSAATAGLILVVLAIPKVLQAQETRPSFVPLDSFPMPVSPVAVHELTDRGLLKVWVPTSRQTVQVREAEAGKELEAAQYWVFVDEEGRLLDSRPGAADDENGLMKMIEAALPKMKFRPGLHRGKPVGAWVLLEFVFLKEGLRPR